jgi:hypothetical protein
MYQAVLARQDSSLVTLSSDDAKDVDATYGNGKFTCNLLNTNRGGTHAIKIVPSLVMIPNVFNNVYAGMNVLEEYFDMRLHIGSITIPYGFYTRDEFITLFNSLSLQFVMSVTVDGYIKVYSTQTEMTGSDFNLIMSEALANMLGFTDRTLFPLIGKSVYVTMPVVSSYTVVANTRSRMATTPIVYVTTRQFGINRMIASNNRDYNVIATISMHDVPYGSYGVFRGQDIFMDDIEFRTPRSLDQVDIELLDSNYNTLTIDPRFEVILQLKVFHTDTTK